jgi:folate-binding protein YgfZ
VAAEGIAKLDDYGLLLAAGPDARAFLHAQLTNDIEHLPPGRARYSGWCSAKGRLLASFLVVPVADGFLLQLARDLVPAVLKRLSMFILRSKVKLTDATAEWAQYGAWSAQEGETLAVVPEGGTLRVGIEPGRFLLLAPAGTPDRSSPGRTAADWAAAEIGAGRPWITGATQDQFVPQMVNYERLGGVDFRKGCYPGQEVVARAQYRGAVKRRMARLRGAVLHPGQEIFSDDLPGQPSGMVVNASGDEALAVLQTGTLESGAAVRVQPGAAALGVVPLHYPQ